MKIIENELLYIIPSYLPLRNYQKKNRKHVLDLGAEVSFKRLQLDDLSFKIFRGFLSPNSVVKAAKVIGKSIEEVQRFCSHLFNEGLLIQYHDIPEPYERYDRHLNYFSLNGLDPMKAQNELKKLRFTFLGMGGIGNWIALNLVGLGVKSFQLIDPDVIELSNLTRQILFSEDDVGKFKVDIARQELKQRNRHISIEAIKDKITKDSVSQFISDTDFVILSADKPFFSIQKWVNEACVQRQIPLLNVGYAGGEGVMGPLVIPGVSSCLACSGYLEEENYYLQEMKDAEDFAGHFRAPSFGCLNSLISCMASYEIVKFFLRFGECLTMNHLVRINPFNFSIRQISRSKNAACKICQKVAI
ncbi:MAG TPA: ThiF family adenylyltransferase [Rhabdochlamydiaceae bacterium]|nr:ThiF family adenylyltransferase [Rhabdochlamydiaceae bacterium]HSX37828.1 ThiF family adenylyltransferase [Chlamydiales bacterium]